PGRRGTLWGGFDWDIPSSLASRSHRDNVGWQIPVRIESADAVGPPGTSNFFTMLALKASLYSVIYEPLTPPASMTPLPPRRGQRIGQLVPRIYDMEGQRRRRLIRASAVG